MKRAKIAGLAEDDTGSDTLFSGRSNELVNRTLRIPSALHESTAYLVLMTVIMMMLGFVHAAALVGHHTGNVLKLNCRVVNAKHAQSLIEAAKNIAASRGRHVFDQNVRAEGVCPRADTPDVKVVDIKNTFDPSHSICDIDQAHPAWKPLKQDIQGFAHNVSG